MPKIAPGPSTIVTVTDYTRPFEQKDFRGYFTWTDLLCDRLGGSLYHGCHEDELAAALEADELPLRSKWKITLQGHKSPWTANGVWCGLNNFGALGNFYGPCLFSFPISVLSGRKFMVFRRTDSDGRERHYFVQHESPIPIFSFAGLSKRLVNPEFYFQKQSNRLWLKNRAIYEIILTEPLPLAECEVHGVSHPRCIPGKCGRSSLNDSYTTVQRVGLKRARSIILKSPEMQSLFKKLPWLSRKKILPL
jgi:hypothetical protein